MKPCSSEVTSVELGFFSVQGRAAAATKEAVLPSPEASLTKNSRQSACLSPSFLREGDLKCKHQEAKLKGADYSL